MLYRKVKEHLSDTQFGFRKGLGTREALLSTDILIQRVCNVDCEVCAYIVNFENALDNVSFHCYVSLKLWSLTKLQEHQKVMIISKKINTQRKFPILVQTFKQCNMRTR